ncbi:MAG: 16S rRNA (adenine(1518)-N(6)/adenine(1519)-N(6))-dimethyltransferase RsmA [Eubacteriales bacterium]
MAQSNISKVRDVLSQKKLSPLKQLGQNFLVDENITTAIAKAAEPQGQNVIEVGPGLGALTEKLAEDAKKLLAVEIDRGMYGYLEETFGAEDNIVLVNQDILKTDVKVLCDAHFDDADVVLAANLPYYITSAVIMHFLEANIPLSRMIVMVQKEVAERLCAKPGDKSYGALTAMVQYFGKPETVMKVSPGCFYPRPEVESAVVRIRIEKQADETSKNFIRFVKACFTMKRKTLVNNLTKAGYEKTAILSALAEENIDVMARAETLSTKELFKLTNSLTI